MNNLNDSATASSSIDNAPAPVLDFAPVEQAAKGLAFTFSRLLKNLAVLGVAVLLGLIAVRLVAGFFIVGQVSETVEHGARVAGLDESITRWLRTVASWGLGFSLVGLVLRVLLAQLLPFGSVHASWKPLMLVVALSGLGTMLPVAIKEVRQVDDKGLPARMEEVDGTTHDWFNTENKPLLWYVRDANGTFHFYNRPDHRPTDGAEVQPVTMPIRHEWEAALLRKKEQAETARKDAEGHRLAAEQAAVLQKQQDEQAASLRKQQQDHERELSEIRLELQRSQERQAQAEKDAAEQKRLSEEARNAPPAREPSLVAPSIVPSDSVPAMRSRDAGLAVAVSTRSFPAAPDSPAPRPAQEFSLPPGLTRYINVRGDNVAVWSNGPVEVSADGLPFMPIMFPGHPMRFQQHHQTIHIRPLSANATAVFVQKLTDQ